jgi:hypothetical protein
MTQCQRAKHVTALNTIIESHGFEANRFGIYHKEQFKIDTRDTNIKIWKGDFKKLSKPLTQITPEQLEAYLIKCGL